jgi:hypothetical protein
MLSPGSYAWVGNKVSNDKVMVLEVYYLSITMFGVSVFVTPPCRRSLTSQVPDNIHEFLNPLYYFLLHRPPSFSALLTFKNNQSGQDRIRLSSVHGCGSVDCSASSPSAPPGSEPSGGSPYLALWPEGCYSAKQERQNQTAQKKFPKFSPDYCCQSPESEFLSHATSEGGYFYMPSAFLKCRYMKRELILACLQNNYSSMLCSHIIIIIIIVII